MIEITVYDMKEIRLQNSRIFCERARSSNESERSGADVKTVSETGERRLRLAKRSALRALNARFFEETEKTCVLQSRRRCDSIKFAGLKGVHVSCSHVIKS